MHLFQLVASLRVPFRLCRQTDVGYIHDFISEVVIIIMMIISRSCVCMQGTLLLISLECFIPCDSCFAIVTGHPLVIRC